MKHILNVIFMILAFLIGFGYIAICHLLMMLWTFELLPDTKWRNTKSKICEGSFLERYKNWWSVFKYVNL
tara:strand:+ start:292 stop:501 length:210 start_codon:yes stop_codon:yes gene_type:complete